MKNRKPTSEIRSLNQNALRFELGSEKDIPFDDLTAEELESVLGACIGARLTGAWPLVRDCPGLSVCFTDCCNCDGCN